MITVDNISKSFPPVVALRDVNMEVGAGSLYGIVGAPGAGKSTLARCIALRERPDNGTVRWDGVSTATLDARKLRAVRKQVAFVEPTAQLRGERTVAGNVAAPLEQLGLDGPQRRERVGAVLDLAGLARGAAHHPAELTAGQRQRVALARALATNPAMLLADDPTHAVDSADAGGVLAVLDRACAELGVTVLLTTPDAAVARRTCDNIALLEQGGVVESGTVLDLLSDQHSKAAQLLLPAIETSRAQAGGYDRVVDTVLIGFAAVGALLPEAASRFDVELATIGGGLTRVGDTPVARFRLGARGEQVDSALAWIAERGAQLSHPKRGPQGLAAA